MLTLWRSAAAGSPAAVHVYDVVSHARRLYRSLTFSSDNAFSLYDMPCALFLHAGDHTGDRTALILVAALIVTTSFQTDLNLGPIQYLIWFDFFLQNIS